MKKTCALLLLLFTAAMTFSQGGQPLNPQQQSAPVNTPINEQDNTRNTNVELKGDKPPITDYRIISHTRDTTYVDTTLTIAKDYKFNYLRKDTYNLLPFSNVGQTYNTLAYDFNSVRLQPLFGSRARHFNYMEVEDISYYHVPTPLTELYFKTAIEQGQQLDAFFTVNTSENFNFSIAYKGVRSLGNYQNILTSTGNFRFTSNYQSKNKRYHLRAHVVFQDLLNGENGGVKPGFIPYFENDLADFRDRGRLEVNFEDAENILKGKRFYLEHDFAVLNRIDSTSHTLLKLGNVVQFEDKYYEYNQDEAFEEFGPAYAETGLRDRVTLEDFHTRVYAELDNNILGRLRAYAGFTDFNYGYDRALYLDEGFVPNRMLGTILETGATYQKKYKGFELLGKAGINVAGEFEGNYLQGEASYRLDATTMAKATVHINSVAPNYNFLLYQSDYIHYNWKNEFRNTKKQHLQFDLLSDKLLNASVSYTGIDDYTYFSRTESDTTTTPFQYGGRVNYLKVEANREIPFGKFRWNTTLTYQNVLDGAAVFKTPELLGRSSIYFSEHLFQKALFLQTGFTAKYFTSYQMNAYDPVLAEFYVQENERIGDFPLVDFFLNAKVSQTRIFIKWEHFNSLFGDKDYYAAPGYPYRDWKIRFGLVWNFFM